MRFNFRPRQIDRLTFEDAVHARRPPRERPAVSRLLPPVLIDADGAYSRQGIMQRAHALARRHRLSQPGRSWKLVLAEALSLAWFEARTAKKARAARLAA
jgi:hypothetical protein